MREIKYSVPKFRMKTDEVRYITSGGTVHCFITFLPFEFNEPYEILSQTAKKTCNMIEANYNNLRWRGDKIWMKPGRCSIEHNYIYNPTDYEYHGSATLKDGDKDDFEYAKDIAYWKAYRRALRFAYDCYVNLYSRVMSYMGDVWHGQLEQLRDRVYNAEDKIQYMINS